MQIKVIFHFLHFILLSVMFFFLKCHIHILGVFVLYYFCSLRCHHRSRVNFRSCIFCGIRVVRWACGASYHIFRLMQIYSPIIVCTHFKWNIYIYSHIIFIKEWRKKKFDSTLYTRTLFWMKSDFRIENAIKNDFLSRCQCTEFGSTCVCIYYIYEYTCRWGTLIRC